MRRQSLTAVAHALVLALALGLATPAEGTDCLRVPEETSVAKTPGNNGFRVKVLPFPRNDSAAPIEGYVPGEYYSVMIEGWRTQYTVQTFRGFTLVAIRAGSDDFEHPVGTLKVQSNVAQKSPRCYHAATHTSLHPKTDVEVLWQAPAKDEGCVDFKATVLEYRDLWYMDDGPLTLKLCAIAGSARASSGDQCCACDEAKYELELRGLWSRQTHPKDFPTLEQLTHFSDLIGASHSGRYAVWKEGGYSTEGMKELAEWGNTQQVEQELKGKGKEVRTIIKAKGLWFPNVQGVAKAMFRVDRYHHLVSVATMLGPSPDWFVGLSAENLCLPNCSWAAERSFELYPWDAGTDGGVTYMSPNSPSLPRQAIRPITTKDPADPRSPFYNPASDLMPPLARLIIRREKVYAMDCRNASAFEAVLERPEEAAETSEDLEFKDRRECMAGSWTPWSQCSATCGKGIRMRSRVYKNPIKAQMMGCQRQMTEKQFCNADIAVCEGSEAFNEDCSVSPWSPWTECSQTCGQGLRTRNRNLIDPMAAKTCSVDVMEKEMCEGEGGADCGAPLDPRCRLTQWSEWSPCSASCGEGMRVRTRLFFVQDTQNHCPDQETMQKTTCELQSCDIFLFTNRGEICEEIMEPGQCAGVFPRYYFDSTTKSCRRFIFTGCKGNRNNFESEDKCKKVCMAESHEDQGHGEEVFPVHQLATALGVDPDGDNGEPVDCMVSEWSSWSECSRTCGRGRMQRTRMIKVNARNGGRACPSNMIERRRCRLRPCPLDCKMSPWSDWSACSVSCDHGQQTRRRFVMTLGRPGGQPCPTERDETQTCVRDPC